MGNLIVIILCSLFYIRGVIIYLRSGLKGELIRALGVFMFVLSFSFDDFVLLAIGFVIFNVGMLILMSDENEYWKEIFSSLTYYERIVGIIPNLLDKNQFRNEFIKVIALTIGVILTSIIFEIFKKLITDNIAETLKISIIAGSCILFIVYSVLKKVR